MGLHISAVKCETPAMRGVWKYLLIGAGTALALLRLMADAVGSSTFLDDLSLLNSRASPTIELIGGMSALAVYLVALLMIVIGILLFFPEDVRSAIRRVGLYDHDGSERQETLPGFSFATVVDLGRASANRSRYIFSAKLQCGGSVDVYLSPTQRLIFRVTDQHGEQHATEAEILKQLKFRKKRALLLVFGTSSNYSLSEIWVDGVRVAFRRFEFAIPLGNLMYRSIVMCADQAQRNHTEMQLYMLSAFPRYLSSEDRRVLFSIMRGIQKNGKASLLFDGKADHYTSIPRDVPEENGPETRA